MTQKFCHHCGKQLAGSPKFCGNCGTSLSSLSATPTPEPSFTPVAISRSDDREGYIDEAEHLLRIKSLRLQGLDVEITKDRPLGETIGSLAAQAQTAGTPLVSPDDKIVRDGPYANYDKKQFLADFQKDSAPAKRGQDAHEIK
jgi:hypothetical protein